jgi:hypothetical protein
LSYGVQAALLFNGNDASLLATLDPHVAQEYPVVPRYALSNFRFHLSFDATDDLESEILTTGSGDNFMKKLHTRQGTSYTRMVSTYISKSPSQNGDDFCISVDEWTRRWAPNGDQIRRYYEAGERSALTPYGYSHFERYTRELQSVGQEEGVSSTAAIDWTFATLKTYFSTTAKAIFTMKIGDGRTAMIALVSNTSVQQISHLLIQMVRG